MMMGRIPSIVVVYIQNSEAIMLLVKQFGMHLKDKLFLLW